MKELKKKNRNYNKVELYLTEVVVFTDDPNASVSVSVNQQGWATTVVNSVKSWWNARKNK